MQARASTGVAPVPLEPVVQPQPSGEPLTVKIRCWTSTGSSSPTTRHEITIHPDWTVTTPHDLESERVALAFGGYLSCLDLAEHSLPAARRWLELQLRVGSAPIVFGRRPRWQVNPPQRCCGEDGFETATKAAEHLRDPKHLAIEFSAPRRQLTDLIKALTAAYAGALALDSAEALAAGEVCSRGAMDVTELWYAGMHPRRILEIHEAVGSPGRLPGRFYLGVMSRGTDLGWLVDTLQVAGQESDELELFADPSVELASGRVEGAAEPVAEWLAWTRGVVDIIHPERRGRWLALGVSRRMILLLDQHAITPDEVELLATGVGRDPDGAARQLAGWLEAGLRPPVAELVRLHESGVGPHWYVPSSAAVRRLRAELGDAAARTSDTDLAFRLAVAGTVPDAVASWRTGGSLWLTG
jgi:hypothetical protein